MTDRKQAHGGIVPWHLATQRRPGCPWCVLEEVALAADRVDSRSSLAGEVPEDGYWVSMREMHVLREALSDTTVQRTLDEYAPALGGQSDIREKDR